ncbi:MAG TPA: DUF493 domain-containing protein [Rhodocyclaceae bacterium]|nr:DUF493 domain-containing protein [Rhodocyclaceae bacterium]
MPEERQTLLEFPCAFPIKIMGARVDAFAQTVLDVVLRHDPGFDAAAMEMRPSSKGTYLAITCTVTAISQTQLDNLYRELSSHPMVKVVL